MSQTNLETVTRVAVVHRSIGGCGAGITVLARALVRLCRGKGNKAGEKDKKKLVHGGFDCCRDTVTVEN
jgi:hypothetical protein